jgi:hypothetical protein
MNRAKIFITFTLLLAFALQVSAQDETPKIVWKNLQEQYDKFQDIAPVIINETDKPIFFYDPYYSVKLAYLDDSEKQWNPIYFFICGTGLKLKPLKLVPQSEFSLDFDEYFWKNSSELSPAGIDPLANLRATGIGKFRLELHYGTKKSQVTETAVSPVFQVKIIKNN